MLDLYIKVKSFKNYFPCKEVFITRICSKKLIVNFYTLYKDLNKFNLV